MVLKLAVPVSMNQLIKPLQEEAILISQRSAILAESSRIIICRLMKSFVAGNGRLRRYDTTDILLYTVAGSRVVGYHLFPVLGLTQMTLWRLKFYPMWPEYQPL